jgi:hypothetical protein
LLSATKKANKILKIYVAPEVMLPAELSAPENLPRSQWPRVLHTEWVVHAPEAIPSNAMIIEVDELTSADLLTTIDAQYLEAEDRFQFATREGFLLKALNDGNTVILKGRWPEALRQQKENVIAERLQTKDKVKGKLILVGENEQTFLCMPPAFQSMLGPSVSIKEQAVAYEARFSALDKALETTSLACLTGATGAGKTQFMKTTWRKYHSCFYGEAAIVDWINIVPKETEKFITLFIDEVNLTEAQRSMFAGLYNNPPCVFFKGNYYGLSNKHRVVFARNPNSYGGERREIALFENYPHADLHFQPLPLDIELREIAIANPIKMQILVWIKRIEDAYPNQLIWTPREVIMIALLADILIKIHPNVTPQAMVDNISYRLLLPHLPEQDKKRFDAFVEIKMLFESLPSEKFDFTITPTMQPVVEALQAHLCLRRARIENNIAPTGGLGGVLIEGPPGIGKSELTLQILAFLGLQEGRDFYHIPVSLDQEEKCAKLLEAFHQGKIAVIDEINSSPMIERLLNALLEERDLDNNPAKNPGFLLVGTQNSISLRGRKETPLPLQHRLQPVILQDYPRAEVCHILTTHYQLPMKVALDMEAEYEDVKQKDKSICFRDIQRWARHWKKSNDNHLIKAIPLQSQRQIGHTCKVIALSNIENYFAEHCGFTAIPMHKLKTHPLSIRELAKQHGSKQGEVLEWRQWGAMLKDLGYTTKTVEFGDDFTLFLQSITDALKKGNLPIIAFAVDESSGQPDPVPYKPEEREHASVITAYDSSKDQFTLKHWGGTYAVDAVTLFRSSQALVDTRTQEHYRRDPDYTTQVNKAKYSLVKKSGFNIKTSILPTQASGFRSKLLVVESPMEELTTFIKRRTEVIAKKKNFDPSFFQSYDVSSSPIETSKKHKI